MMQPHSETIKSMFSKVAKNYDKANSVLSIGIHHLWRKKLVTLSGACAGGHILDCATGTGDLAIEFKKMVGPSGKVIGTDFCEEMLSSAPEKAKKQGLGIHFEAADVLKLQYPDNQFNITSISFGIRNVRDPIVALKEMARVTKPQGRVMILEFGQMRTPFVAPLYGYYSKKILPLIGGFVTGEKEAYVYLQESSAQFPCREEFIQLMEKSEAFQETQYYPLMGGIAYIYKGIVK